MSLQWAMGKVNEGQGERKCKASLNWGTLGSGDKPAEFLRAVVVNLWVVTLSQGPPRAIRKH